MIDIPYAAREVSIERLRTAARSLEDKAVAETVLEKGMQQLRRGRSEWLPRLVLLAAQRLGRAQEVLPIFEQFLAWNDTQSKADWHADLTERGLQSDNLFAQSGRPAQDFEAFDLEFQRVTRAIGPPALGPVLDVGCGGGLWTLSMAKFGYEMTGTDHHRGVIDAASRTAAKMGVADKAKFLVDDISNSAVPSCYASRIICTNVTGTLPDDNAFYALIAHLDRISKVADGQTTMRRVVLGLNRWMPSRMSAVKEILLGCGGYYLKAFYQLYLIECTWWMHQRHIDEIKKRFPSVTLIGKTESKLDGVRVDLLLQ